MILYIKNMVCGRCKRVVRESLERLGLAITRVDLGEVEVINWPAGISSDAVRRALQSNEFELLDDPKMILVEQLKTLIVSEVFYEKGERPVHQNFSDFLAEKTGHDYAYLSALFSATVGMTIEKYTIVQKVEKVKELLAYGELSISAVAFRLGYSSVQHLSTQFKQVTGQTPGAFRQTRGSGQRRSLDKVEP